MVKFCEKGISILKSKKNFDEIGNMLNENWNLKKKLSNNVSNKKIDKIIMSRAFKSQDSIFKCKFCFF